MSGFVVELELFRREEEAAQQHFYAYLALGHLPSQDRPVLDALNQTPLFWLTVRYGMLGSAFLALGRIFDQKSPHNLNTVLRLAGVELSLFTRASLVARKVQGGLSLGQARDYAANKTELSAGDIRSLRHEVASWRRVWDERYRDIRDKVFAHNGLGKRGEDGALFGATRIDEILELLGFLSNLHRTLDQAFLNGRQVAIGESPLEFPPTKARRDYPGERVFVDAEKVLARIATGRWP